MKMLGVLLGLLLLGLLLLVGCSRPDKAAPEFRRCEALEAEGKLAEALGPCALAIEADPKSPLGLAAEQKIRTKLQPAWNKMNQERLAAYEKASVQKQETNIAALRLRVKKKFWELGTNGECTGKGYPPFRWTYEGGTFEEDNAVASADGCTKLARAVELQTYCCPQQP